MPDLETTWFLLIGVLLVGYAILDGFDLGVGILHLPLARDDHERRLFLASIAPVWDGNEVWLITAVGALFAAFPAAYATVFSGFYLPFMLLLAALILRATAVEFRGHGGGLAWRAFWDRAFAVGSFVPALVFGITIGNVMRGLPLDTAGKLTGTFVSLLNPFSLGVGMLTVALFTMQGAAWLVAKTEGDVQQRARRAASWAWAAALVAWAAVAFASTTAAPDLWRAYASPWPWAAPTAAAATALAFPWAMRQRRHSAAFAASSGMMASLIAILGLGLYPYLVPGRGAASGITIYDAASSPLTLRTMLGIALVGMPLVVAYTAFIYRSFRGPVQVEESSY